MARPLLCPGGAKRENNGLRCGLLLPRPPRPSHPAVIGKAEGLGEEWHGHVTAISVAPEYRRLQLANKMMNLLEYISDKAYHGFFVDLFARCDNKKAIDMYERIGYSVYRRIQNYYGSLSPDSVSQEEDAFGAAFLGPFSED